MSMNKPHHARAVQYLTNWLEPNGLFLDVGNVKGHFLDQLTCMSWNSTRLWLSNRLMFREDAFMVLLLESCFVFLSRSPRDLCGTICYSNKTWWEKWATRDYIEQSLRFPQPKPNISCCKDRKPLFSSKLSNWEDSSWEYLAGISWPKYSDTHLNLHKMLSSLLFLQQH